MKEIDLNCDMGESFGLYQYGADKEIMPYISSANIACGFHAGDPSVMRETVTLAVEHGVNIGAHIGFPDRLGFGRRKMDVNADEVYDYTLYQLGALDAFLRRVNVSMNHIKLHGALYMMAADRRDLADATVKAVVEFDPSLKVYSLPGSELTLSSKDAKLTVLNEYFADRPYNENGVKMFGWTPEEIGSPLKIAERTLETLSKESDEHSHFASPVGFETICVHSDTPSAPLIVKSITEKLSQSGWNIKGRMVKNQ